MLSNLFFELAISYLSIHQSIYLSIYLFRPSLCLSLCLCVPAERGPTARKNKGALYSG